MRDPTNPFQDRIGRIEDHVEVDECWVGNHYGVVSIAYPGDLTAWGTIVHDAIEAAIIAAMGEVTGSRMPDSRKYTRGYRVPFRMAPQLAPTATEDFHIEPEPDDEVVREVFPELDKPGIDHE